MNILARHMVLIYSIHHMNIIATEMLDTIRYFQRILLNYYIDMLDVVCQSTRRVTRQDYRVKYYRGWKLIIHRESFVLFFYFWICFDIFVIIVIKRIKQAISKNLLKCALNKFFLKTSGIVLNKNWQHEYCSTLPAQ